MGVTLQELLENSGIASMGNEEVEKTASEDASGEDLVVELRKLASEEPERAPALRKEAARELAEKTAEIFVIQQTMQEIDKLASLGVNEDAHQKLAVFVKVAMDAGHTEEEIARFLKEASVAGRVARAARSGAQALRRPIARKGAHYGTKASAHEFRLFREKMVKGNYKEGRKHLEMLESQQGRPFVTGFVQRLKGEGTPLPSWASRYLPRQGTEKVFKVKSGTGLKEYGPTAGQAKATAAVVGGGLLGHGVSGRGKNGKSGGGVTVIRS